MAIGLASGMEAASAAPVLVPDAKQALTFFATLFPAGNGESIHFRGVSEPKDNRSNQNLHYALDENFSANVGGFLEWCAVDGRAAFFLPGVVKGTGAGKKDVLSLPAVLVDFDKGDTEANLRAAESVVGPATVVVESGGQTEAGPKLHAYWRLDAPADGEAIAEACRVREALALRFGGDPAFKQPAQVIRVPGSLHLKRSPTLVKLRTVRPEAVYSLPALGDAVGIAPSTAGSSSNFFDFNSVDARQDDVGRALTAPVHEGGIDELTRFEAAGKAIGHFIRMVREGRMAPNEAWLAVKEWNVATLVPPWSEQRLRTDFDRLVRADVAERGPLVAIQPAIPQAATGLKLTDWYAKTQFIGRPPGRRWLVEGLIPRGTPGVFAAVGDAGKSMLALQLANVVASYPAPATTVESPAGISDTPFFFGQPIVGRGAAVFLTGEDDRDEVHRRLDTIDPIGAWRAESSRLMVIPLVSAGGARSYITSGQRGPEFTPAWHELRAQLEAMPDLALVVLDPLTLFVGGDTNDNTVGAAFMGELNQLAARTGAAIVLVHHFAKSASGKIGGLSDARNAVLGAGAWVNNARWSLVLWEAEQDPAYSTLKALGRAQQARQAGQVYFGGLTKSNAPGAKVLRTLVRGTSGVLEDRTDELRALAPAATDVDEGLYRGLCAMKEKNPRFSFTKSPTALWEALGAAIRKHDLPITKDGKARGKHAIVEVVERLIDAGKIAPTDDPSGKRYEPVVA